MKLVPLANLKILRKGVPPKALIESISRIGILTPLTISRNGVVTNGVLRYLAARELGLTEVPTQELRR